MAAKNRQSHQSRGREGSKRERLKPGGRKDQGKKQPVKKSPEAGGSKEEP